MPKYDYEFHVPAISGKGTIEAANQGDADRAAYIAMNSAMERNEDWTWSAKPIKEPEKAEVPNG
jgi:hypothetical protein